MEKVTKLCAWCGKHPARKASKYCCKGCGKAARSAWSKAVADSYADVRAGNLEGIIRAMEESRGKRIPYPDPKPVVETPTEPVMPEEPVEPEISTPTAGEEIIFMNYRILRKTVIDNPEITQCCEIEANSFSEPDAVVQSRQTDEAGVPVYGPKQAEHLKHSKRVDNGHRCCDCGKQTPDHRCPSCRKKWLRKHHVSDGIEGLEGYFPGEALYA